MVMYVSFPTHLIEKLFFSVKSTKKLNPIVYTHAIFYVRFFKVRLVSSHLDVYHSRPFGYLPSFTTERERNKYEVCLQKLSFHY